VSIYSYKAISEIVGMSVSFCREAALAYRKSLGEDPLKHKAKTRKGLRLLKEKMEKKTDLNEFHIAYITSPDTLKN